MRQTWNDLLFAHWPLPADYLRRFVPPELQLDTFEGEAWIAVAPFWMSHIAFRGLPPLPGLSRFPELNVRTYVRGPANGEEKPGVYFFSLDAGNPLAVLGARISYSLPYYWSLMKAELMAGEVKYSSRRPLRRNPAEVRCTYRPIAAVNKFKTAREQFLTERYCLYAVLAKGRVLRGNIHHVPWQLQPAQASWEINSVAAAHNIDLQFGSATQREPLLHYSKRLDVFVWLHENVR